MTYARKKKFWIESGLPFQWQFSACSQEKTGPLLLQDNRAHLEAPELWLWGQDSGPSQDLNRTQDSSSVYLWFPGAQDLAWQRKETNNMTRHRRPHVHYLVTLQIHVHDLFPLAVFVNNEDWHSSPPPTTHTHVHVHIPTFALVNPHTHHPGLYLGSTDLKCRCASESPGRRVGWTGRPELTSIHYWYYA